MEFIPFEIQRQRWRLSALKVQMALLRCGLFLKTFNPNQPRGPAGEPDGGQWTKEGESARNSSQDDTKFFLSQIAMTVATASICARKKVGAATPLKSMWEKQT